MPAPVIIAGMRVKCRMRHDDGPSRGGLPLLRAARPLSQTEDWQADQNRHIERRRDFKPLPPTYPDDEPPTPDGSGRIPFAGRD